MTLPADRARCNPQANDCACKEQCLRYTDKPPVYRPVPFCDFSIFLTPGAPCEMLIKADDFRVAYLCDKCHHELDQGTKMTRSERVEFWEEAHRHTIGWLFKSGKVKVA